MTETKKHIVFLVNPISGTKNKKQITAHISKTIDPLRFTYEVKNTSYRGHAAVLAGEAAAEKAAVVVAVGGDGTVNEVARALTHTDTALGIIPCGSGNGLARHLQIPMKIRKALEIINECNIQTLDYGLLNGTPFFCTCGMGFDAFVSLKFANAGKRGLLSYLENTLREGLRYKPDTYIIEDEARTVKHEAFLIACANASQYGNNAYIAPQASMSDGLMDITIMKPFSMVEAPQIALQLFNRTLKSNRYIEMFQAKKIKIRREHEGAVHCDGDPLITGKEIDVELIGKGINIITNPAYRQPTDTLLQIFADYFNHLSPFDRKNLSSPSRVLSINKELLRKLRNK